MMHLTHPFLTRDILKFLGRFQWKGFRLLKGRQQGRFVIFKGRAWLFDLWTILGICPWKKFEQKPLWKNRSDKYTCERVIFILCPFTPYCRICFAFASLGQKLLNHSHGYLGHFKMTKFTNNFQFSHIV